MVDKICIQQVLGSLMKHPQYLSETDRYTLTPNDFSSRFEKYIFIAINGLYSNGTVKISPLDVENYLQTNDVAKLTFNQNNGVEYLQDLEEFAAEENFPYYYNKLKKINLIRDLQKSGIDTTEFYLEDVLNPKASEINAKFEDLNILDIITSVKKKILGFEKEYMRNDVTETISVLDGIDELLGDMETAQDIGLPLQGEIFNEVVGGARTGCLYIRSGSSGLGKSRSSVADACYLAFPVRYDWKTGKWISTGSCEKVLYIATEQDFREIQKMILAYLTDINESRFRYGKFTKEEQKILEQAKQVLEIYQENMFIVRMPNPTIELIKSIVRENCLLKNIQYVFYDYIFIGPALLGEFRGFALRNDELLLMMATALKDLSVELGVFIMTSTQVNANADDSKEIRNEASLSGGRSTINKADVGAIMARPTKDELDLLSGIIKTYGEPNIVTDIYKVRAGQWTQVRIWSKFDLGTLKKEDLFITDSRLNALENFAISKYEVSNWEEGQIKEIKELVERLNS